jgi:dipeptidyl aminopeptidase/acylaminoacyl peptidase
LVVMPHGGPERRDFMTFDVAVQYLAARGYAVFQPNFRGSSGWGKSFAESGYGEWGRKMQSDISDGLKAVVDAGLVDPGRVCIVGASYGGYAALAGVSLTPELYRCAVSTAGISDLKAFVNWRKAMYGADSGGYTYWLDAIGDPATAADRLTATSPINLVSSIKAPLLLIHGSDDGIVPLSQSEAMMRALDKAGKPTKLIVFEGEGHSFWSDKNQKAWLIAIDRFLWQQLGPGSNVTTPPTPAAALH